MAWASRTEEVGLLEEERIDLVQIDELVDLQGAVVVCLQRLDLFIGEGDVLALRDRIAADQLIGIDDLLVMRTPPLAIDARPAARVQQIEVDIFRMGGRIETDRDGDEAERNRRVAQRSECHETPPWIDCASAIPGVRRSEVAETMVLESVAD
jgi:hypothetical protein